MSTLDNVRILMSETIKNLEKYKEMDITDEERRGIEQAIEYNKKKWLDDEAK